jgi:3-oxoacyl-[acyl-carrier protein] reductase
MTGSMVAVVTGGSRGIGRAVAVRLARDGVAVVVGYGASPQAADEIVASVRLAGGSAVAVRADVADAAEVGALFERAESEFGGVDIVVTSAGILRPALIAEATDNDFTEQVEVNIRGTFNALREGARRVRDGGRIVTLSSTTLALNAPGYGV